MPVLIVAVSAISAAAVLVRLVPDLPAPVVALWRCGMVALLLAPALKRPARRELLLTALAGLALALHFWTWFESLRHTTVLRSTVLVCLSPVWTALLERLFLGHRTTARYWAGVAVALGGIGAMAAAAPPAGASGPLGDALAVLGGMLAGVYLVSGRAVRQRMGIFSYGSMVSGFAALWLLPVVLLLPGEPAALWDFPGRTWLVLLAMAAGPQFLGHVGLNFAVRYLPAAVVSLVVLLEPAGAAALAGLVLGEWPGPGEWAGAALILVGVAVATARRRGG
ncbi:MAG: DMT family transporter [Alphaproteobacteria bacterium]|nr:DMT family transporter [Alphaproteobacteria bacterium]